MKFDFGDGNGPVPARKHKRGGGIVADTATVSEDSYVGPDARVFGYAAVHDGCLVMDRSQAFGYSVLSGGVIIRDDVSVSGNAVLDYNYQIDGDCILTQNPKVILGFDHPVIITDNNVIVGCRCERIDFWKEHGAAIIKVNGLSSKTAVHVHKLICDMIELHNTNYNAQ